jgi:hypothetical protein
MSSAIAATSIGAAAAAYGANRAANAQKQAARMAQNAYSGGVDKASGIAQNARDQSIAAQNAAYETQRAAIYEAQKDQYGALSPYSNAGQNALTQQQRLLEEAQTHPLRDFTEKDFHADPGYAFRLAEGQKALERSAGARGGLYSGQAMKDFDAYTQGMASQEYKSSYDRFNQDQQRRYDARLGIADRYGQQAGLGQQAAQSLAGIYGANANSLGQYAGQNANNNSNLYTGTGNSLSDMALGDASSIGNSYMARGNADANAYGAYGQALGNILNAGSSYFRSKVWGN